MVIKWTNRYSMESGYVKAVSSKNACFINTFDRKEAKEYATESAAKRAVTMLTAYGEAENNLFSFE